MIWGPWLGPVHIISLAVAAGLLVGLYFLLKPLSMKWKTIILGILSMSGIVAIVYNLLVWNSPIEYLPLHMCSINAILLPIAIFTRNKYIGNLLTLWSVGALLALVMNNAQCDYEILSWTFAVYYFPHMLEFGIPILLFKFKMIEKDPKCIWSTLGITAGIYTVVHFLNLIINEYCINAGIVDWAGEQVQVNYMYSLVPEIPILQMFYDIIPFPYWYMYVTFPIIAVVLLVVYLPDIRKNRKLAKAKTVE